MIQQNKKIAFLVAALVVLSATCASWGQPRTGDPGRASPTGPAIKAAGTIQSVTVYRGQALVTRVINVNVPEGAAELDVTGLPAQIVPGSLYASAEGNVQVRAVRYRTEAVLEEPRDEVRKIDQQVQEIEKAMRKNQAAQNLHKQKEAYLANLEGFAATKAKEDLAKGVLNAEALKAVTELVFKTRTEMSSAMLDLTEEQKDMQTKLDLLQRQRSELAARFSKTAREAAIFLDRQGGGKVTVRLNYLVQGALWAPIYNLRAAGTGHDVTLEYSALVNQMSGENWDGVKLTLSTASPTMLADAPILTPLWVTLGVAASTPGPAGDNMILGGQKVAAENLRKAIQDRYTTQEEDGLDWNANKNASALQIIDMVAGKDVLLAGRDLLTGDSALSVNYALPGTISVPSRNDQQMIQIAALKLRGDFYYQAAPVLSTYVYQQADIVNTSEVALLSGPVNSYMDGQFMGNGRIPMVAKGQRFTVGFGVDSQLRVVRELADKVDRIQGGNRELTFTYRLLIDNYKDKPVKVRLLDRMPDPKGAEIRVTMQKASTEVSQDPVYQRTLNKMGILRWEIDVPAQSSAAKAKTVEYSYRVEFDKNMRLAEPAPAEVEKGKAAFKDMLEQMKK